MYTLSALEWAIGQLAVASGDSDPNALLRSYNGSGSAASLNFQIARLEWGIGQLAIRTGDATAWTLLNAYPGSGSPTNLAFFLDRMAWAINELDGRESGDVPPAYLPEGYVLRDVDNFRVLNLCHDTTLTDAGIQAQPGRWGYSDLWYQNAFKPGLPGFGMDFAMNPLASMAPASFKATNPLGMVNVLPEGGIELQARPATALELAAIPDLPIGGTMTPWISPMLSTRFKQDIMQPAMVRVLGKLPKTGGGQFPAWWFLLTGGRERFPGVQANAPEIEPDLMERFNQIIASTAWHATMTAGYTHEGYIGQYDPTGIIDMSEEFVWFVMFFNPTSMRRMIVKEDGTVLSDETLDLLTAVPGDILAVYQTTPFHFIANESAGIPASWGPPLAQDPVGGLDQHTMTLKKFDVWAPESNTSITDIIDPPEDTALALVAPYDTDPIPLNPVAGTVIGNFTSATAEEFDIMGGGTFVQVVGDELQLTGEDAIFENFKVSPVGRVAGSGWGCAPAITIQAEVPIWYLGLEASTLAVNYVNLEARLNNVPDTWTDLIFDPDQKFVDPDAAQYHPSQETDGVWISRVKNSNNASGDFIGFHGSNADGDASTSRYLLAAVGTATGQNLYYGPDPAANVSVGGMTNRKNAFTVVLGVSSTPDGDGKVAKIIGASNGVAGTIGKSATPPNIDGTVFFGGNNGFGDKSPSRNNNATTNVWAYFSAADLGVAGIELLTDADYESLALGTYFD
jgi:hypothetical protein